MSSLKPPRAPERSSSAGLTAGRLIARNTWWNFLGQALPLLVGLVAIPALVDRLGTDRFGILTLVWMVIGYFGLFDFGLGRALTKLVAERLGAEDERAVPALVWIALGMMGVVGVAGAIALGLLSPWMARDLLAIDVQMQAEATTAFAVLAATIPIVITSTALRGVLEAYQRFDLVAFVRVPSGVWTFLGPVMAALVDPNLVLVVVVLAIGRTVAWISYFMLCARCVPGFFQPDFAAWAFVARSLVSFGGWMTVSNVVNPVMVRLDRVVIGATMTMAAVAYYATPYEIITRLWIIPSAIVGVLFPAFSSALVGDRPRAALLFERGNRYLFLAIFPIALTVVALAPEGLGWWLGDDFAYQSTPVLRWLTFGVWVNCMAHVPFALIQADGSPSVTAKLHLVEAPFYLLLLWALMTSFGIEGAAIAWAIRVVFDTAALQVIARRRLPTPSADAWRGLAGLAVGSSILALESVIDDTSARSIALVTVLVAFIPFAWTRLLRVEERDMILRHLRRRNYGIHMDR